MVKVELYKKPLGLESAKRQILSRYGRRCHCCGLSGTDRIIDVHHINKNRQDNRLVNLLPLCRSCHKIIHLYYAKGMAHSEAWHALIYRKGLPLFRAA